MDYDCFSNIYWDAFWHAFVMGSHHLVNGHTVLIQRLLNQTFINPKKITSQKLYRTNLSNSLILLASILHFVSGVFHWWISKTVTFTKICYTTTDTQSISWRSGKTFRRQNTCQTTITKTLFFKIWYCFFIKTMKPMYKQHNIKL